MSIILSRPGKKQSTAPRTSSASGHERQGVPKQRTGAGHVVAPKQDRRVGRTRRTLHEALLALILERGWDEVSVQDVCARADVGRSTFYVHFADKEELLLSGFDDLRLHLRAVAASGGDDVLGFSAAMFQHAREHERLFRALVGKRTADVVHRRFVAVLSELLDEDLADVVPVGPFRDAAVRYLAGAFWELLLWWCDQSSPTAIEVDAIFRRLTMPVLRELKRWAAESTRPAR